MAGTKIGGQKAAKKNKEKYGGDFYRMIGSKGGQQITSKPKGFAANLELAKIAGAKGGKISRRGPSEFARVKDYVWHAGEPMWEAKDEA